MEINIKMMKEEAYRSIQKDCDGILKMINEHPSDSSWLSNYLGFEPYETKKYVIEDFDLKYDEDYNNVAFDNAVILYESLNKLPKYILCNNRFWAWINMEKAYKQAKIATKNFNSQILKNLWFMGSARRDIMLGVMSRYYNMIEVSIDESKEDKYELSKFILTTAETYRGFCYRNLGMIKNVTLGVLQAEKDYVDQTGNPILKKPGAQIVKYASRVGSVMLLDMLSKEEMRNYIYPKINNIIASCSDSE
jgi:hypothetical protein